MMQQSPILESRRPPSPRVFYPGSPKQTNQSESPSFISDQSPRANFNQAAEENRNWNAEKKVRKDLFNSTNEEPERPKPPMPTQNGDAHAPVESTENLVRTFDYSNTVPVQEPVQFAIQPPKKFIDYSRTNPLSDENRPDNESRESKKHRKRSPRRDKRSRSRDRKDRKKKSRDKRSREKSRSPSPKSKKSSRDRPKKSDRKSKIRKVFVLRNSIIGSTVIFSMDIAWIDLFEKNYIKVKKTRSCTNQNQIMKMFFIFLQAIKNLVKWTFHR